jgi:2-polyprenyl-6-hydroxyphenyl methylase / 3-demethylubiquinone-9 3-methyltransferase
LPAIAKYQMMPKLLKKSSSGNNLFFFLISYHGKLGIMSEFSPNANIDKREIERFSASAPNWWRARGEFKALHDIQPVRMAFIRGYADPAGRAVLDVGCGGGLISEGLAAAGARVTAIDMSEAALAVARDHLRQSGLSVVYRKATVETMAEERPGAFDIVTCMELVEHVPDPASIVRACGRAVKPGGHVFFATVNRTWLSGLLVVGAAEYLLGIVRKGTHHYHRLVRPSELIRWGRRADLDCRHLSGMRYIPFWGAASLCAGTRMNYMAHFIKPLPPHKDA